MKKLHGYLPGYTMPNYLQAQIGEPKKFSDVKHVFKAYAAVRTTNTDHVIPKLPPVYDQLELGSCVLNAVCGMINIVLAVQGMKTEPLARLFLYFLCRQYMGTLNEDSGTYIHLAAERVAKIGVCEESMWPYQDNNFLDANGHAVKPTPECFPAASDNRPTAWFHIETTGRHRCNDIETAILANHPVGFGTQVDSKLQGYKKGEILTKPDEKDLIGGHAMVFVGVRYIDGKRFFVIRNSWGKAWGDAGYALADESFVSDPGLDDLLVLTRMDALMF